VQSGSDYLHKAAATPHRSRTAYVLRCAENTRTSRQVVTIHYLTRYAMAEPHKYEGFQVRLREARPADVPAIVDAHFSAFSTSTANDLINPAGGTDEVRKGLGQIFFPATAPPPHSGEAVTIVAELVPPPGRSGPGEHDGAVVIGYAKWSIYREERTEEQWNTPVPKYTAEQLGPGYDAEAFDAYLGDLKRQEKRWTRGNRCLGTYHPSRQPLYKSPPPVDLCPDSP
jgi:hypothetical protein